MCVYLIAGESPLNLMLLVVFVTPFCLWIPGVYFMLHKEILPLESSVHQLHPYVLLLFSNFYSIIEDNILIDWNERSPHIGKYSCHFQCLKVKLALLTPEGISGGAEHMLCLWKFSHLGPGISSDTVSNRSCEERPFFTWGPRKSQLSVVTDAALGGQVVWLAVRQASFVESF